MLSHGRGRADGFSGSDLKALCARAALAPVRELLSAEREAAAAAADAAVGAAPPAAATTAAPPPAPAPVPLTL